MLKFNRRYRMFVWRINFKKSNKVIRMRIANPLYDVIFKYLMEHTMIAIDILSAILGENIVSLELKPQELVGQMDNGVKVTRMDFKAVIKTKAGILKASLIELEKNKRGLEIPRFRWYLGFNYSKETIITTAEGKTEGADLPIMLIYFLGYDLNKNIPSPILKIGRTYQDVLTGHVYDLTDDFVEALSHDLYIIQISKLSMAAQTELEELLDVFNVAKYKTNDKHILEYTGTSTNPKVKRLVRHLNRAIQLDEIVETMKMEDDEVENAFAAEKKQKEDMRHERDAANRKTEEANRKTEEANRKTEEANREKDLANRKAEEAAEEIEYLKQQVAAALKNKK